jgi:hypothetical protein
MRSILVTPNYESMEENLLVDELHGRRPPLNLVKLILSLTQFNPACLKKENSDFWIEIYER